MTLGRLVVAWLAVALWFAAAVWLGRQVTGAGRPPDAGAARRSAAATAAEAGLVTLFAALWFDSLGSGGWWLLFLLVGLLAAFPVRLQGMVAGSLPRRPEFLMALVDTARYVGAGAILAWRLR